MKRLAVIGSLGVEPAGGAPWRSPTSGIDHSREQPCADRERDRNSWSTTPTLDDHEVERDEHGLAEQEQRPSHWTGFAGCAEDSVQHARSRCDREAERRG